MIKSEYLIYPASIRAKGVLPHQRELLPLNMEEHKTFLQDLIKVCDPKDYPAVGDAIGDFNDYEFSPEVCKSLLAIYGKEYIEFDDRYENAEIYMSSAMNFKASQITKFIEFNPEAYAEIKFPTHAGKVLWADFMIQKNYSDIFESYIKTIMDQYPCEMHYCYNKKDTSDGKQGWCYGIHSKCYELGCHSLDIVLKKIDEQEKCETMSKAVENIKGYNYHEYLELNCKSEWDGSINPWQNAELYSLHFANEIFKQSPINFKTLPRYTNGLDADIKNINEWEQIQINNIRAKAQRKRNRITEAYHALDIAKSIVHYCTSEATHEIFARRCLLGNAK